MYTQRAKSFRTVKPQHAHWKNRTLYYQDLVLVQWTRAQKNGKQTAEDWGIDRFFKRNKTTKQARTWHNLTKTNIYKPLQLQTKNTVGAKTLMPRPGVAMNRKIWSRQSFAKTPTSVLFLLPSQVHSVVKSFLAAYFPLVFLSCPFFDLCTCYSKIFCVVMVSCRMSTWNCGS